MIVESGRPHEGHPIAFGRFIQRGFIEGDFRVGCHRAAVRPGAAPVTREEQMRLGAARFQAAVGGHHPINSAISSLTGGAPVVGRSGAPKNVPRCISRHMGRLKWPLPGTAVVFGAQNITAQKSKTAVPQGVRELGGKPRIEQRPAVAAAQQRPVAQLQQAGVLRPAERMGINQFRFAPACALVPGPDQDQLAVGVGVRRACFAQMPSLRRAAKGHQELAVGPAHD